jgi:hypothetical protein
MIPGLGNCRKGTRHTAITIELNLSILRTARDFHFFRFRFKSTVLVSRHNRINHIAFKFTSTVKLTCSICLKSHDWFFARHHFTFVDLHTGALDADPGAFCCFRRSASGYFRLTSRQAHRKQGMAPGSKVLAQKTNANHAHRRG